jgi:pimeloyl-ACP methyl ester carboxylesterase
MRQLLAALFIFLIPVAVRSDEPRPQSHSFDSGGVRIHYVTLGNDGGEPVVLIHGFTGSSENWPQVFKVLNKDYRVIALDCRGHGQSDKPHDAAKYGLEMIEDVVRLLDHLKIKKAHVVGYSMGAGIALQLAVRHPERLRSAVLGGNGMPAPGAGQFYNSIAESLEQDKGFGPLIMAIHPKDQPKLSDEQIKQISAYILAKNDGKALAAVMRGMTAKEMHLADDAIRGEVAPI